MTFDRKVTWQLWESLAIDPMHTALVRSIAKATLPNEDRYRAVGDRIGAPWYVIAVIHYRESSFNFRTHLANGDPLWDIHGSPLLTVHVPKGLGPYLSWEEGAEGALRHMGWSVGLSWDLVSTLMRIQSFNGNGYLRHGVNSPYVWSLTNVYHSGLFTRDGHYDPLAIDHRPGCAALLVSLKAMGIDLNEIAAV